MQINERFNYDVKLISSLHNELVSNTKTPSVSENKIYLNLILIVSSFHSQSQIWLMVHGLKFDMIHSFTHKFCIVDASFQIW